MSKVSKDVDQFVTDRIITDNFAEIMGERFERYAKYIIQERALPDARDGLKPVQRRILFAMYKLGLGSTKPHKKSARIVGDVIGKYHPHGDTAVYEAMVRMSQDFKILLPLIDMHGNNGSIDGDGAAAMRYTEARLSTYAEHLLEDLGKRTVGFVPNFDDEELEPVVLPAKFPNLLVNGSTGIAEGYSTDIPPHNPGEVIDAVIYRMQNKNCKVEDILNFIQGPDFPTGAIVQGYEDLKKAYETGKGKVVVKAKCEITPNGQQIIITEIPYEVNKAQLLRQMSDQLEQKNVDGVSMIRDETDRSGLRIVLDIKKGFNAENILTFLFKTTNLQRNYCYNMVAIMRGKPTYMSILDFLDAYIDHEREVIRNRCNFDLERAEKRQEVVNGLIAMVSILDAVIATIRKSKNKADAKENLITKYNFTEIQAEAIVMLQLYRLTNTDIVELKKEAEDLVKEIKHLKEILDSNSALNKVIIKELQETKEAINVERKTKIEHEVEELEVKTEDVIAVENHVIVVTRDGYIKKLRKLIYENWKDRCEQAVKTKDKEEAIEENKIKDGDVITDVYNCTSVDTLLMFSTKGNYAYLPVHKIPEVKLKDMGLHISTLINMEVSDKVIFSCIVPQAYLADEVDPNLPKKYILLGTRSGNIKRMDVTSLKVTRYSTIIKATKLLDDNDCVVGVDISSNPDDYVCVCSHEGYVSIYKQDQVSVYQQSSVGVIGQRLDSRPGDYLIGAKYVSEKDVVFILTNRGNVKRFQWEDLFRHDDNGERVEVKRGNIGDYKLKRVKSAPHYAVHMNVVNEGNNKAGLNMYVYCGDTDSVNVDFLTTKDAKDGNGKEYVKDKTLTPVSIVIERNDLDIK